MCYAFDMQKLCSIFIISLSAFFICCGFCIQETNLSHAYNKNTQTYYGRINSENVYLYSNPVDKNEYKLFLLPCTYFVQLTGKPPENSDLFYTANYMDISGFVKQQEVVVIDGTPQKPYVDNLSFSIFSTSGLELRTSPEISPFNIVSNVSYLEKNLIYYGCIDGEEMIPQLGKKWYYCKYLDNNSEMFGYLYSGLCYLLPSYEPNYEVFDLIEEEIFEEQTTNTSSPIVKPPTLSEDVKIIIVICATLPCIVIIYLLFKPTKLTVDNGKNNRHKKYKKFKRQDYYEDDE